MKRARIALVGLGLSLVAGSALSRSSPAREVLFDVPPQSLNNALNVFAKQSDLSIVFFTENAERVRAPAVSGSFTPEHALRLLLADSDLTYEFVNNRTVSIRVARAAPSDSDNGDSDPRSKSSELAESDLNDSDADDYRSIRGIPEILVKGSSTLDADIKRTRDDARAYVVFDRKAIEQTGAENVEELFRNNLTSMTGNFSNAQTAQTLGTSSKINIGGLGSMRH